MANTEEQIRRAEQARRIMDDPLVVEALIAMRSDFIAEWERAPARDVEGRERLWVMVKTIDKFKAFFAEVMGSGVVAQHNVQKLRVGQ